MIAPRYSFPDDQPHFVPGDIVKNHEQHYRGVVVAVDLQCQASTQWYQELTNPPDRQQPWYHILVDGCSRHLYAAQSSLEADSQPQCIVHPWINLYFGAFEGQSYLRNHTPWPHSAP